MVGILREGQPATLITIGTHSSSGLLSATVISISGCEHVTSVFVKDLLIDDHKAICI